MAQNKVTFHQQTSSYSNFRLLNFATGNYHCKCSVCGETFTGDKRAVQCLRCAFKAVEQNFKSLQLLKAEIAALVNFCDTEYCSGREIDFESVINSLRQLSAV